MEKYYIVVEGDKKGPYALTQLREMWKSGDITMDAKYATEGMKEWADIGELMEAEVGRDIVAEPAPLSPRESAKKELESKSIKKNIVKSSHVELKDCPACGEAISRDAATCPACGCNFYQRWMRIFLTIILPSIIAVLVLFWLLTTVLKTASKTTLNWGVGFFLGSLLISICIMNKDRIFYVVPPAVLKKTLSILFWLIGFAVVLWGPLAMTTLTGSNWYGLTLSAVLYLIITGGVFLFRRWKQKKQSETVKKYVNWKKDSGRSDN